jgi:adenosylmethionine-8-amino-7-oxononanoate aminotransferase
MDETDRLKDWDRHHLWHAFSQMASYDGAIIQSAEGCWLETVDGTRLLDGASSMWCIVHGHRHPVIDQAIRDQLDQVAQVTLLGMSHPVAIRLAKRLAELAPGKMPHVFFSSDGSSSVEVAVKMAFQYWQQRRTGRRPEKTTYLAVEGAYHGDTLGSVSVGGIARFVSMFQPLLFSSIRAPTPDTYRLPPGIPEDQLCSWYLDRYRQLIAQHAHQLAAVVVEPLVMGAAGMVMAPPGFLRGLREITRQYEVLLIADEIAVGIGRTGTLWACQQEEVEPDLLCTGKGLSGGYLPIAATLATSEIWEAFLGDYSESRSFFHGHTFGGNPLACAAALANLELLFQEQTLQKLPLTAEHLAMRLAPLASHPHVGQIRQRGLIAAVELVADRATKTGFPWSEEIGKKVCQGTIRRGTWLRPLGNVIPILPPLSIGTEEIDHLADGLMSSIEEVLGKQRTAV